MEGMSKIGVSLSLEEASVSSNLTTIFNRFLGSCLNLGHTLKWNVGFRIIPCWY